MLMSENLVFLLVHSR